MNNRKEQTDEIKLLINDALFNNTNNKEAIILSQVSALVSITSTIVCPSIPLIPVRSTSSTPIITKNALLYGVLFVYRKAFKTLNSWQCNFLLMSNYKI